MQARSTAHSRFLFLILFFSLLLSGCLNESSEAIDNTALQSSDTSPPSDDTTPKDPGSTDDAEDPKEEAPAWFGSPRVPVTESRAGTVHNEKINIDATGDVMAITVMEPTELTAGETYPLILHGHGYGGKRALEPSAFQQKLRDAGYYVISIDQRGFGESSGTVRIMSPDFEGQNLIGLLDWAEELPGLARFADDNRMAVGSYGGSYGGMYQYLLIGADPLERLRVIAPDMTPYNLSYSLSSHNVPKSGWAAGLVAMGEVPILDFFGLDFPEQFMRFLQKELINEETRGEATNQDPIVVESLLRGLLSGKLSESTNNMLRYNSLKYFCDGEPAGPQDGFILGQSNPRVEPKRLPPIDALISQGVSDTLFNLNEAVNAYECLSQQGGDVRLITHQSGHILPLSADSLPQWTEVSDPLYAMFRVPEFQGPGGGEHCATTERFDATFSWFEEKLKGKTELLDNTLLSGKNVCLSLADDSAVHVKEVKKGGTEFPLNTDTPTMSGPFGLLASLAGSLPSEAFMQTQPIYTVPAESGSQILAGIPRLEVNIESVFGPELTPGECFSPLSQLPVDDLLQEISKNTPIEDVLGGIGTALNETINALPLVGDLPLLNGITKLVSGLLGNVLNLPGWLLDTTSDALPLACDPIYFISLGKQLEGTQRWHIINGQVTPLRGYGYHSVDLNGIATELNPGDKVALMIMGGNLQYPLSFSRDLLTIFATMNGKVYLPLLSEEEILHLAQGTPEQVPSEEEEH